MTDLLIHSTTKAYLKRFIDNPTHAILLLAPTGSGKRTIANFIANSLLKLSPDQSLVDKIGIIDITPQKQTITIEVIRDLQQKLRLKTIGKHQIRRVVLIEAAHQMTHEAQNALLKMLEEPPADTVFVLTAPTARSVLPTIYSRTHAVELRNPPTSEMGSFLINHGFKEKSVTDALRFSGNRLGLACAILQNDKTHPLLDAVTQARTVLTIPLLERLQVVDEWSRSRETLSDKLEALLRICQAGVKQAAVKQEQVLLKRWQQNYQATYDALTSLRHNPNNKLLLTHLFLQFG